MNDRAPGPGGAGRGIEDCGAFLEGLRPRVPRLLVDDRCWRRLLARAGGRAASFLGFEFRLGGAEREADFVLALVPGSDAERAHVRRGRNAREDSVEAGIARLLVRSGAMPAPLATMLEYDVAGVPAGPCPPPAVFQGPWRRADRARGIRDPLTAGRIAGALAAAVGRTADDREVAAVRSLVGALPPPGRLAHVGAMPGREPRMVRVMVAGLDAGGLTGSLRQLGWPGPMPAVAAVLDLVKHLPLRFGMQLEVAAQGLLPRLGVEIFLPPEPQRGAGTGAARGASWRPVLTALEQAGCALPGKSRGLLAFPGREPVFDDGIFEVRMDINHVKISVGDSGEEGRPLRAKAYGRVRIRRPDS